MRKEYRVVMWVIVIALIVFGYLACRFANEKTQEHLILSVDKVENTTGTSEGFSTEVYYLVTTDKGAYKVVMEGFNAAPQCAGVKKDSTYILTTRGIEFPMFGIYQNIIGVAKK